MNSYFVNPFHSKDCFCASVCTRASSVLIKRSASALLTPNLFSRCLASTLGFLPCIIPICNRFDNSAFSISWYIQIRSENFALWNDAFTIECAAFALLWIVFPRIPACRSNSSRVRFVRILSKYFCNPSNPSTSSKPIFAFSISNRLIFIVALYSRISAFASAEKFFSLTYLAALRS